MDITRLTRALRSIDARVVRMTKYASDSPALSHILDILTALQVTIGHYLAEPSQLDSESVTDLRQLLSEIDLHLPRPVSTALNGEDSANDSAIVRLLDDCRNLSNQITGLAIGLAVDEPAKIEALVPEQKVAPFQFAVAGDRLVVKDQKPDISDRTAVIADSARNALMEQGSRIIEDLHRSNISPRLRQSFETLQEKLTEGSNIIAIGMFNLTCGRMISADIVELPDTMTALLVSQVEGVNSLLAQYPEWRDFAQASMSVDIDQKSVDDLILTARLLAERLRDDRLTASEGVTKALDQVAEWAEQADAKGRREALSLGRTLGNLLSVVLRAMSSFGKDVKQEAKKGAAKAVVAALLSVAAFGFGLAASRVPGGEWIEGAISYLREVVVPPSK